MSQWIDVRLLREEADFPTLLQHYNVNLRDAILRAGRPQLNDRNNEL